MHAMSVYSRRNPSLIGAALILILLLGGCAQAPPSIFLAPEYRNVRESEVSILVLPYVGKMMTPEQWQLFIERKTKENKLVTSLEVELYESYFQILLSEKTHARVIPFGKATDQSSIRLRRLETDSGLEPKISLYVPASGRIQINGEMPEYLFIVQDLFFLQSQPDGRNAQIPGHLSKGEFVLESGIDYLIWDNKKDKTVAYGRLNKKTPLLAPPNKELYLNLMQEFVISIVKNSPLAEKEALSF